MTDRPTILVVEDEVPVARDLKATLEGSGFQVPELVKSGSRAIRAAVEHQPDLVLIDIHLQGEMDGVETAEQIRRRLDMPVVFLTAYADHETVERAKLVGPFGFLLQPFQERELCSAVEVALYKHRMETESRQRERLLDATTQKKVAAEAEALRRSEEKIRALLEHGSDIVGVLSESGRIRYASPSTEAVLGYRPDDLMDSSVLPLVHEDSRDFALQLLQEVAAESGVRLSAEIPAVHSDGSSVILEVVATNAVHNPLIGGIAINARDITERRTIEESLRRSEEKFRQLFETMAQGVVYQMADGSINSANPAAERILGLSLDQMQGRTSMDPRWRAIREDGSDFPGEDHPSMVALRTGKPVIGVVMGVFHPQEDSCRWIGIDATPEFRNGETTPYRVYATFNDITARKEAESQLVQAASFDSLTGLANRALLLDRLRHVIVRARRRPNVLYGVLFLDLDRFKTVNDSLGHHCGDLLLVECAERLSRCLRAEDTAARFGGDEFVILLEEIADISEATRVAERVQAEFSSAFDLKGRDVFITASIGIVVRSSGDVEAETILRDADLAMYRAKEKGRARWELYDTSMHERVLAKQVLESDLHHALHRQQFSLCFQPIVEVGSGDLRGFEALPRWVHPELGVLLPGEFLPAAEEIGLLVAIERWCLREACQQVRFWSENARLDEGTSVSVNISGGLLNSPALIPEIETILRDSGLAAGRLKLEISGATLISDLGALEPVLSALNSLGVGLHVDDFGTSLASVDALIRFSFERIKVSQSLISTLSGRVGGEVMQTMIAMARRLGLGTIVKGVETEEQARYLGGIGCDQAQGRYFSEPLAADEVLGRLARPYEQP